MVEMMCRTWGSDPRNALLLHGVSSDSGGWWRLGPDVATLGYSVVAPDFRGHGSSPPGDDYRRESYRDDVL
ncbi:MAG: alpha/beta hydrolase, partial [Acidimicrobiia bacterium]|nr:alpha/beta hydrolase [Acidimicrobiia bacterium]